MIYIVVSIFGFFASYICSHIVRRIALARNVVDVPDSSRKIHRTPRPLLGGVAIYASFFLVLFVVYVWRPSFFVNLTLPQILALFVGSTILMLGGYADDRWSLPARVQLLFPVLAALAVIAGGVRLTHITNPFGGPSFELASLFAHAAPFVVNMLVFIWLMAMMYTTKILDGVDGLVSGITTIGAVMIFLLTQTARFFQPDVGLISLLFAAACAGFLVLNFPPAKLFLGEGGSLLTGFMLGNLAIIAGSKIATTLLVMGLPMIDLAYTVYRRVRAGMPLFKGDAGHLHFRLLQKGMSARRLVLLKYIIAAGFGASAIVLESGEKIIALAVLACASLFLIFFAHRS